MATVFSSPEIGSDEATPPRNSGIRQRSRDIVYPVSQTVGKAFESGRRVEFRFRSDSSRFISFRDTNLVVRLESKFIPAHKTPEFSNDSKDLENLRLTAAPCTALFGGGMEYQCNSVVIENQPHPYEAAMLNLLTKGDSSASRVTGSNSLLDLSKGTNSDKTALSDEVRTFRLAVSTRGATVTPAPLGYASTLVYKAAGNAPTAGGSTMRAPIGGFLVKRSFAVLNATAQFLGVGDTVTAAGIDCVVIAKSNAGEGLDATGALDATLTQIFLDSDVSNVPSVADGPGDLTSGKLIQVHSPANHRSTAAVESYQQNPKHNILKSGLVHDDESGMTSFCEISEPVMLQSWQHGWACPGADHQLFLQINSFWKDDLFVETPTISPAQIAQRLSEGDAAGADAVFGAHRVSNVSLDLLPKYSRVVNGGDEFGTAASYTRNGVRKDGVLVTRVTSVELHVGYVSPIEPFVPRSVSWAWSSIDVQIKQVQSKRIMESIVIKPSVRLVVLGFRQNKHGILCDREELGKAGAKIVEQGHNETLIGVSATLGDNSAYPDKTALMRRNPGTGNFEYLDAYIPKELESLEIRCGSEAKPTPAYTDLSIDKGHYARPYADFIQAIGKNMALRGGTITFEDYIGKNSANRVFKSDLAQFERASGGDRGPLFFIPLLLPAGSLQNVLTIDAQLKEAPDATAQQEMVVMTINDELWNMAYSPPNELPISTSSRPLL